MTGGCASHLRRSLKRKKGERRKGAAFPHCAAAQPQEQIEHYNSRLGLSHLMAAEPQKLDIHLSQSQLDQSPILKALNTIRVHLKPLQGYKFIWARDPRVSRFALYPGLSYRTPST